ncbi:hypothetical protein IQ267_22405 [filamentous cyanobacterium LEGE 07170]|nr:hypothetical protein [filamentous cyanobacterium LEGE 07170]
MTLGWLDATYLNVITFCSRIQAAIPEGKGFGATAKARIFNIDGVHLANNNVS